MEQENLRKITIIGPESTGKSTLCGQLAQQYGTIWCPEYAREYLLEHGMNYTYEDLLTIAKGQIALEEKYIEKASGKWSVTSGKKEVASEKNSNSPLATQHFLFIDTDMYVMKVWCEFVFGRCHQYIIDQIVERRYDLYLLCNIDLPWKKDELREYPDMEPRRKLYHIYKDILINQNIPWTEISGNYEERLEKAIVTVNTNF